MRSPRGVVDSAILDRGRRRHVACVVRDDDVHVVEAVRDRRGVPGRCSADPRLGVCDRVLVLDTRDTGREGARVVLARRQSDREAQVGAWVVHCRRRGRGVHEPGPGRGGRIGVGGSVDRAYVERVVSVGERGGRVRRRADRPGAAVDAALERRAGLVRVEVKVGVGLFDGVPGFEQVRVRHGAINRDADDDGCLARGVVGRRRL